tara:strand:- start:98 stop:658 length:561 start_codon:yes stop_codon:yes gene_type:complete
MSKINLVLASSSPRRHELLRLIHPYFEIKHPCIKEKRRHNESPDLYVKRLSKEKAYAIKLQSNDLILSADTIVFFNQEILEKPQDRSDAIKMLKKLSNTTHYVYTGFSFRNYNEIKSFHVVSEVAFRIIRDKEIDDYVNTDCPLDKAGSYAIQGEASKFVHSIKGSYTNIIGLPLCEVSEQLSRYQ